MTGQWKNWDIPSSFNLEAFALAIETAKAKANATEPKGIVFVEGILLFSHSELLRHYTGVIALYLEEAVFKVRRFNRDEWLQENKSYFDEVVIPAHQVHGSIPELPHCKHFRVDATLPPQNVHQMVLEQLELWRQSAN
jgi:hypothetical protein